MTLQELTDKMARELPPEWQIWLIWSCETHSVQILDPDCEPHDVTIDEDGIEAASLKALRLVDDLAANYRIDDEEDEEDEPCS